MREIGHLIDSVSWGSDTWISGCTFSEKKAQSQSSEVGAGFGWNTMKFWHLYCSHARLSSVSRREEEIVFLGLTSSRFRLLS